MGVYADYYGNMTIPQEKRAEFCQNVETILQKGGILQFETASLLGTTVSLLRDPEYNEAGELSFHYCYFSDERWESAAFDRNRCRLFSGKVGSNEFQQVVSAIYLLYEFYAEEYGVSGLNGRVTDRRKTIGWLNEILDQQFTNERREDRWKLYAFLHSIGQDGFSCTERLLFNQEMNEKRILDYLQVLYVEKGIEEIQRLAESVPAPSEKAALDPLTALLRLHHATKVYLDFLEGSQEEKTQKIIECLASSMDELRSRFPGAGEKEGPFLLFLVLLGTTITTKAVSEVLKMDFWELWEQVKGKAFAGIFQNQFTPPSEIEPKVSTADFFYLPDDSFDYHMDGYEAEENFHFSDDDRLHYWKKDGDVQLSESIKDWFSRMRSEYDAIQSELRLEKDFEKFVAHLTGTLDTLNNEYGRIYLFRSTFYEFLSNWKKPYVQTLLALLDRLAERNKPSDDRLDSKRWYDWDLVNRNILFHPGRVEVKRLVALLSNLELRRMVFPE